jgi:hypothetical protein
VHPCEAFGVWHLITATIADYGNCTMLDQLENLTNKFLDGRLEDAERNRLNELLREEEFRRRFVELNKVHFCLSHRSLPSSTRRTAHATSAVHQIILSPGGPARTTSCDDLDVSSRISDRSRRGWRSELQRPMVLSAAAVLVLVCCVGIFVLSRSPLAERPVGIDEDMIAEVEGAVSQVPDSPSSTLTASTTPTVSSTTPTASNGFAARIVSMSEDALWDRDSGPADFLMRLSVGEQLALTRGVVKLEFATEAFAVLSAPAKLKILGPGEVLLQRGKLSGRSEEGDFIIQTPSAYVVDIGTVFGVSVDDKAVTDVVVFDGEVHVQRTSASKRKIRLTSGMSIRADSSGLNKSNTSFDTLSFIREFNGEHPNYLGIHELSMVDIICGSAPGEYRLAGSIDPEMGTWSTLPWSESKGVRGKVGKGEVVPVDWNPWVHGIFVPDSRSSKLAVDLDGGHVDMPPISGGAWGPVWARRRINHHLDPLAANVDRDVEGFWGAGTTTALLDRSRWVRDGIVGLHANVGITIDLEAIRREYSSSIKSFRGVLAHLEKSHVSQPFHPQAEVTFQIYVDEELRYERKDFCRQDGDAMFGVELHDSDHLLSLIVTDSNDGPIYDRVILLDPILETSGKLTGDNSLVH